jgi:hypothetical protein
LTRAGAVLALLLAAVPASTAEKIASPPGIIHTDYALFSGFYARYTDARGIPVLGSAAVDDAALFKARHIVNRMVGATPFTVRRALRDARFRLVVLAHGEAASAVPEWAARYGMARDTAYWAGFGATPDFPIAAITTDNLTGGYGDEDLLVFHLAGSIADIALRPHEPHWDARLKHAYDRAHARGAWDRTHASLTPGTYWAEGVQAYFGVNRAGTKRGDGIHNRVNSRRALRRYDPALYAMIEEVFGDVML